MSTLPLGEMRREWPSGHKQICEGGRGTHALMKSEGHIGVCVRKRRPPLASQLRVTENNKLQHKFGFLTDFCGAAHHNKRTAPNAPVWRNFELHMRTLTALIIGLSSTLKSRNDTLKSNAEST